MNLFKKILSLISATFLMGSTFAAKPNALSQKTTETTSGTSVDTTEKGFQVSIPVIDSETQNMINAYNPYGFEAALAIDNFPVKTRPDEQWFFGAFPQLFSLTDRLAKKCGLKAMGIQFNLGISRIAVHRASQTLIIGLGAGALITDPTMSGKQFEDYLERTIGLLVGHPLKK